MDAEQGVMNRISTRFNPSSLAGASGLQIRRAYERHTRRLMPDVPFSELAAMMIKELGEQRAVALIHAEPNDLDAPEPEIDDDHS
jgi:hypothetical protein